MRGWRRTSIARAPLVGQARGVLLVLAVLALLVVLARRMALPRRLS